MSDLLDPVLRSRAIGTCRGWECQGQFQPVRGQYNAKAPELKNANHESTKDENAKKGRKGICFSGFGVSLFRVFVFRAFVIRIGVSASKPKEQS
jgi:hypothetical protein